ncbi:hypothetical protein [Rhodoferax antarcticus]|uniref:Uncharacterized protein n=1 Tax=Rhodoferax antarcticus ANT.BR TaxID=1111071 RepID=A0A1Q8Y924_9BURK|nr:hypothetical protein [Rhodoferax antarcticus]OLP04552.1 hypothetical protein BLL52_4178 [Rhodoferax antarcticus ANT.BR]
MEIQLSSKFKHKKMRVPVSRPVRFAKFGDQADHVLTSRMREIKSSLGMTTNELARAVNRYEKEFGRPSSDVDHVVSSSYLPIKAILLSSYLQGWVMQDNFIESFHRRLEAYWKHTMSTDNTGRPKSIRPVMDAWFEKLGIDPTNLTVSPHRELCRRVTHLCKRAVVCDRAGVFQKGTDLDDEYGWYAILDDEMVVHRYVYRKADDLLIANKTIVAPGDVVQYSKEIVSPNPSYQTSQENPINQSTYYRWYRSNKMPRSRVATELIENAVNEAAAE